MDVFLLVCVVFPKLLLKFVGLKIEHNSLAFLIVLAFGFCLVEISHVLYQVHVSLNLSGFIVIKWQ